MRKVLGFIISISFLFIIAACGKNTKFDKIYKSIEIPKEITENIELPRKTDLYPTAKLSWISSHSQILSSEGRFIRPDEDVEITLELVIQLDGKVEFYEYKTVAKTWDNLAKDTEVFKNPAGFASLSVSNRKNQVENFYEVNNEVEFLEVLKNTRTTKNVVIKINKDLNMGSNYVKEQLIKAGKTEDEIDKDYMRGYYYRKNQNTPLLHPILKETGVGQLIIDQREGLMIYSDEGITLNHLTVHIKGNSKDIVFRNLKMTGIWEWDEEDKGDYKVNDWDYFTLENVDGVWLDHITFNTAYDGIVDAKTNVQNVTLSWLDLDFVPDDFIKTQFDELEANRSKYPYYNELRNNLTKEQIMTVAAAQKKGFNFGNTEGGIGFENITITMHHIYAKNLQDRFPRLRRGDIHMYNVVLDSSQIYPLRTLGMKVISQGLVPTEQGAILMENSRFVGVNEAVKTHQASNLDPDFTGRYLVKDSEYRLDSSYYLGSSTDQTYNNPWHKSNTNIDYDLDFYFRNYQEVPYEYQVDEAVKLTKIFKDNPIGVGKIEGFNWLDITGQIDSSTLIPGVKIDQDRVENLETVLSRLGQPATTQTPKLYNFYTGKELKLEKDFTYYIDHNIETNVPGVYKMVYIIQSLIHEWDQFKYEIKYVVYDESLPNEIYDYNISNEFNETIDVSLDVYVADGSLYYLFTNTQTLTAEEIINHTDTIVKPITSTTIQLEEEKTNNLDFIHFVTLENGKVSPVVTHKIEKEVVVKIETVNDFFDMLMSWKTRGNYYILQNDLDFTDYNRNFPYLDGGLNRFQGIFDGQNFTLKNIDIHRFSGGVFHTVEGGIIKNVIFDNVKIQVADKPLYDEDGNLSGSVKAGDRSGIVAGRTFGKAWFENIVIKNSSLDSNRNYAGLLVGRIETGSTVYAKNITLTDSTVYANGNTGGLLGSVDQKAEAHVEDIYIHTVNVESTDDMVAVLIARLRGIATGQRIVIINTEITSNRNMGGLIGKVNSETTYGFFKDVFINNRNNIERIPESNRSYGHIAGNLDVQLEPLVNVWGTNTQAGGGLNIPSDTLLEDMSGVNENFWTTNFPNIVSNENWEIVDDILKLK